MFRVALASVLGHKVRLALTALAIVLGVAFVSGSFVLTDSMDRAFGNLLTEVNAGTDLYVNGVDEVDPGPMGEQPGLGTTVPETVLEQVRGVEGVAQAVPGVEGMAQVVGPDGEATGGMGPPTFAVSWSGPDEPGPLTLREGRAASGPDEATIDAATAETIGYAVGDRMPVQFRSGVREFEIVGVTGFGDADNMLGATMVTLDLATAQDVLDMQGEYSTITVVGDGQVPPEDLRDRVEAALDRDAVEVVTAETQQAADQQAISEGLGFFTTALLAFAGVAVFVGIFLIVNTFSIIVAQRTREFALLRAVGASSRQVRLAVTVEALVVGVVAGALGLVAGIGLSTLLRVVLDAAGIGLPDGGLVVEPRTVVVAMLVGVVVTVLAALAPARRASRVSPMEALRDEVSTSADGGVGAWRTAAGVVMALAGAAGLLLALADVAPQPLAVAGAGAALAFVGVSLLAPHLAAPVSAVVGALPARRGLAGRLGRNNASGNPRRTASTASALMIGVALVSFVSIFSASATASVNALFADQLGSDFVISATGFGPNGVPPAVAEQLQDRPELGAVSPARGVFVEVDGDSTSILGVEGDVIEDLVALDVLEGSGEDLDEGVMVHQDLADAEDLAVGDTTEITFRAGPEQLPVVGIYANRELVGTDRLTDVSLLADLGAEGIDTFVFADAADGVDASTAREAIDEVLEPFAGVQVQDQTELIESLRRQVDGLLNVMIGLLALALLIALVGIVNTLALSVFERTREIGLLRAVGMTRRQVRWMVRWEAVIVAVFGSLLGVLVGSVFGWALVNASAESGLQVLEFPVTRLAVYVVLAGLAGVVAAVFPARRAARLDVLEAVTTE